jgi:hypothetical protein
MAGNGRRNADDALAVELAGGKTLRDAATAVGVSERTATRRWADPEFRKLVSRHRSAMANRAVGELSDSMTEASRTLRSLLGTDHKPAIRLAAARSILEFAVKGREAVEMDDRLHTLEHGLKLKEKTR